MVKNNKKHKGEYVGMIYEQPTQETLFNAGIDIALDISKLVKHAEFYASNGNYPMWHLKLEAIERRMWTKFRENEKALGEIKGINSEYIEWYRIYLRKLSRDKKISNKLMETIKTYLSKYEKTLIFWRDKFGYGMPAKDDPSWALA